MSMQCTAHKYSVRYTVQHSNGGQNQRKKESCLDILTQHWSKPTPKGLFVCRLVVHSCKLETPPVRVLSTRQQQCAEQVLQAAAVLQRRGLLGAAVALSLGCFSRSSVAAEQGILPSDYTVPAKPVAAYLEIIQQLQPSAVRDLKSYVDNSKYIELSNSLVLSPVDDIRQAVLYVPAALYKDGKVQAAIGSRKAYTDFVRELKRLDLLAQKAARYDADDEDVFQAIDKLSLTIDAVLASAQQ